MTLQERADEIIAQFKAVAEERGLPWVETEPKTLVYLDNKRVLLFTHSYKWLNLTVEKEVSSYHCSDPFKESGEITSILEHARLFQWLTEEQA